MRRGKTNRAGVGAGAGPWAGRGTRFAGLAVVGLAVAGLGLVGCEADNGEYQGGMPPGGSSASIGLAPDGRCAEVYTRVEKYREDGSLWATVEIHREGPGLGGTVQLDGEEPLTIVGWEREARRQPDGPPLKHTYVARMDLVNGAGEPVAAAFFLSVHAEADPAVQLNMALKITPPEATDWEATFLVDAVGVSLRPPTVDRSETLRGEGLDCL